MPLILAGPMLRQVTPRRVTVWVALRARADVTLNVAGPSTGSFSATRATTRIGPNLHLVAVTAMPNASTPMEPGEVYQYDLSFSTDAGSVSFDTALDDVVAVSLAYLPYTKPSFALPPADLKDVRLIQGSCRKPNGGGYDAFTILDQLLQASATAPLGRPHQLLLTGDQIYADEVADVLLLMLTDAAELVKSQSLCERLKGERRGWVVVSRGRDVVDRAAGGGRAMRSSLEAGASCCGPRWVRTGELHAVVHAAAA
ncbi:MAG: hypothetical protein K8M05_09500 [Deltaproteobacteria bacterium]|nr:hypothetical protein [Kofleriaceae bacterium]